MLYPVALIRLLFALAQRRETLAGLGQRFGRGGRRAEAAPVLWIHGASLGELTAARGLIQRLRARHENLHILITCNTYTARDMVANWQIAGLTARLAPLDTPAIVARFLKRWQPVAAITLENEIWPARILLAQRQGIAMMVLSARMSEKTAATWGRFPRLARRVMTAIPYLAPLDPDNGARFRSLGLPDARMHAPVNLKASVRLPDPDAAELAAQTAVFKRADTVLAASTHEGEDALILAGFAIAQREIPRLRLILAPRHPARAEPIMRLVQGAGFQVSRRSKARLPQPDDAVYLADTIGEMPLWYAAAAITVVGGSFVKKGGHTPVEPVQFASLVVHGPDTANHRHAYQQLGGNDAAFRADGPQELAALLVGLHARPDQRDIAQRAVATMDALHPDQPDFDALIDDLGRLAGAGGLG